MTATFRDVRRQAVRLFAFASIIWLAGCGGLPVVGGGSGGGPRVDTSKPVPVALLVPSGSPQAGDAVLAQSLENAARLAMADLQGIEIDLRVYSTGGNAQNAAAAADTAVRDGAKIILGPVYAVAANAAGAAVASRGVNVLSFSNNSDVAGGNVFILGHTFENTASRLVSYAVSQGKRNMMIAYGRDASEQKGRDAIAASMARAGATLAGETAFELSQNGVIQAVDEVAGTAKSTAADAIFFTSGTAGALPILTQLVIENGVNRDTTQFIGLQRWDIPPSAQELPGLQGGWFALPSPGLTRRFRSRYEAAHGEPPHPIAGLAYDGIAAIGALLTAGNANALSASALTQPTGFAGVNGAFRFLPNGTNERGLAVATIIDNEVSVIDPAPRSFTGAGF